MKKLFIFLLIFSLFAFQFTSAETFTAQLMSYDSLIQHGERATFRILITNELNEPQSFSVRFPNSDWTTHTNPVSDYTFSLNAKATKILEIFVSPRLNFPTGPYAVPVRIRSDKSGLEFKQINLPVQIYTSQSREYIPTFVHEINMPYENDPRESIYLEVVINNLNYRNITSLNIEVKSKLFEDNRIIQLGPMQKKTENFIFEIDDLTKPIDDKIEVKVWTLHDDKNYSRERTSYYKIISYSNLIKDSFEEASFLKEEILLKIKNDGNVVYRYEIPIKMGTFKSFFSSFDPIYTYKISSSEGKFLVWEVELEPQEEFTINVKTSYWILVIIVLILIFIIALYYIFRPPIKIKKEVSHVGTSEGGISDIKIILFVKNRTSKVIEDISIIEKIPHLVSIGKEFQVGTLMPSKVMQNPKKGTLVKWNLQTLEGHEERIVTYKIKSKLSILGGLTLPATIVKYSVKGKESKTKSNILSLEI